ncbi:hypothetical protein A2U01_0058561, partial [Trifolium medium]|nr:hypothetical protein [Trifolium medium]
WCLHWAQLEPALGAAEPGRLRWAQLEPALGTAGAYEPDRMTL